MMQHRIETLPETLLVGCCLKMSFSNNRTADLWKSFMPRRKEITHVISSDLFSVQRYPAHFFDGFDPELGFEKWAAVPVRHASILPDGMERMCIPEGLYVVFDYKGSSANAPAVYRWILSEWIPASAYELDNRPHFEILGEKYRNNHPESEEEIWIPIRPK